MRKVIIDFCEEPDLSRKITCEEKLGYLQWHEEADARDKAGMRQISCSVCSLWQWDLCERGRREPMECSETGRCHDHTSNHTFPDRASFDRFVEEWNRNNEAKRQAAIAKAAKKR